MVSQPANTVATAINSSRGAKHRTTILLIDDEDNILRSLKRLLRKEPYDLITTTSVSEALAIMNERPIELIISDQRMPEMNGTELLKRVRDRWPETIRMILSGYSEVESILGAVNEGAIYKYLTKPWNDEELKLSVRRAVEQAELMARNRALQAQIEEQNRRLRAMNIRLLQTADDAMLGMNVTQQLMDSVSAGLINIGSDGMIVGVNQRAIEILGSTPDQLHGETAPHALPPEVSAVYRIHQQNTADEYCTEMELQGKPVQICSKRLHVSNELRGLVLTLWEKL